MTKKKLAKTKTLEGEEKEEIEKKASTGETESSKEEKSLPVGAY
jgi:hypothetical protein